MVGSFGFKLSANYGIALKTLHTIPYIVLSIFYPNGGHHSRYLKTGSVFKNVIFENKNVINWTHVLERNISCVLNMECFRLLWVSEVSQTHWYFLFCFFENLNI